MQTSHRFPHFLLLFLAAFLATAVTAEPAWVSDEFEITLRSGPSTSNAIQLMLRSGTRVEVLERDAESGYSRVRTGGGTEGWVLTRYLMEEPAARQQLAELTDQLTSVTAEGSSLTGQLRALRGEYQQANARIESLEEDKAQLQAQLSDIQRTAADVLAINNQNATLRSELDATLAQVASLEQANRELEDQAMRQWFLTGALVLLIGIALGLWLPRLRSGRRSRYGGL